MGSCVSWARTAARGLLGEFNQRASGHRLAPCAAAALRVRASGRQGNGATGRHLMGVRGTVQRGASQLSGGRTAAGARAAAPAPALGLSHTCGCVTSCTSARAAQRRSTASAPPTRRRKAASTACGTDEGGARHGKNRGGRDGVPRPDADGRRVRSLRWVVLGEYTHLGDSAVAREHSLRHPASIERAGQVRHAIHVVAKRAITLCCSHALSRCCLQHRANREQWNAR